MYFTRSFCMKTSGLLGGSISTRKSGKVGRRLKIQQRQCPVCRVYYTAKGSYANSLETCSRTCGTSLGWRRRTFGYLYKQDTPPKETPSTLDIAWAAGLFEGEGSCHSPKNSTSVVIVQKDQWILWRLQALFGGAVTKRRTKDISDWRLCGAAARGFLMTTYKFLSPRRKAQAIVAFGLPRT